MLLCCSHSPSAGPAWCLHQLSIQHATVNPEVKGSSRPTRVLAYRLIVANGRLEHRDLKVGCLFTRLEVRQLCHVPPTLSACPKYDFPTHHFSNTICSPP